MPGRNLETPPIYESIATTSSAFFPPFIPPTEPHHNDFDLSISFPVTAIEHCFALTALHRRNENDFASALVAPLDPDAPFLRVREKILEKRLPRFFGGWPEGVFSMKKMLSCSRRMNSQILFPCAKKHGFKSDQTHWSRSAIPTAIIASAMMRLGVEISRRDFCFGHGAVFSLRGTTFRKLCRP